MTATQIKNTWSIYCYTVCIFQFSATLWPNFLLLQLLYTGNGANREVMIITSQSSWTENRTQQKKTRSLYMSYISHWFLMLNQATSETDDHHRTRKKTQLAR